MDNNVSIIPTIVVATYNRLHSLKNLMKSLLNGDYSGFQNVRLIVSIDRDPNSYTYIQDFLETFKWPFGEYKVILHETRLGLKEHFMYCNGLSLQYEKVIFLEDDFIVSPQFYQYASKAIDFYGDDERIAGLSLYELRINEFANRAFTPIEDGGNQYFVRLLSWGQVVTRKKWKSFLVWYEKNKNENLDDCLPSVARKWGERSFKREYLEYLILCDKYYVFPRVSYVTNCGLPGEHYNRQDLKVQRPILMSSHNISLSFIKYDESIAVYDEYMEILPERLKRLCPSLEAYDLCVDLYGIKPLLLLNKAQHAITSKNVNRYIFSYGRSFMPHEVNIVENMAGDIFHLSYSADVGKRKKGIWRYYEDNYYDYPGTSALKLFGIDIYKALILKMK